MRVLLVETTAYYPSSPLFLEALRDLATTQPTNFEYAFVDQACFDRPAKSIAVRIVRRLLDKCAVDRSSLNETFLKEATLFRPDVVLICKGQFIEPATLSEIKRRTDALLVNYATDDPFNERVSSLSLLDAIGLYDIYA